MFIFNPNTSQIELVRVRDMCQVVKFEWFAVRTAVIYWMSIGTCLSMIFYYSFFAYLW